MLVILIININYVFLVCVQIEMREIVEVIIENSIVCFRTGT